MHFPKFLRVAVFNTSQTVRINSTSVKKLLPDELGLGLAELFSRKLGFLYEIVTPSDNEIGKKLVNGSWTGLMQLLLMNKTDIIATSMVITEQRKEVIDFTYPFYIDRFTFVSRKPEYEVDYMAFLKVFSKMVWGISIITFLAMLFLFYIYFKKRYSFSQLVIYLYSTIFWQSAILHPQRVTDYFLLSSWSIGIMFLGYCYTANFFSSRTIPSLTGVETVTELANAVSKNLYTCYSFPGSFLHHYLSNSIDPRLRIIGKNLESMKIYSDIDKALSDNESPLKPAFIVTTKYLLPFKQKYFISDDTIFSVISVVATRKDFCCKEQLNRVIRYVWAAGLYQKILDDVSFKSSMEYAYHNEGYLERQLSVGDLLGAFILLICGYILSVCVFLVELVFGKLKKMQYERRRRKHPKLKPPKSSCEN